MARHDAAPLSLRDLDQDPRVRVEEGRGDVERIRHRGRPYRATTGGGARGYHATLEIALGHARRAVVSGGAVRAVTVTELATGRWWRLVPVRSA